MVVESYGGISRGNNVWDSLSDGRTLLESQSFTTIMGSDTQPEFSLQALLQAFKELPATDWAALFATFAIVGFVAWVSNQFDRRTVVEPKSERVLVVGASSGIGKAIALQYAARGASVAVMGRRKPELQSVQADCQAAGSTKATAIVADFSDVDAMIKARNAVERGEPLFFHMV